MKFVVVLTDFFFSHLDQTVCVIDKSKGCSQFCKPGYQSYECSCAYGWKLQQKEKCVPAGESLMQQLIMADELRNCTDHKTFCVITKIILKIISQK